MKSIIFGVTITLFVVSTLFAQNRRAGQAVVPIGWENMDSVRFGLFGIDFTSLLNLGYLPDTIRTPLLLRMIDSVSCKFDDLWGTDAPGPLGPMKGEQAGYADDPFLYNTAVWFKQRTFVALPQPEPSHDTREPAIYTHEAIEY